MIELLVALEHRLTAFEFNACRFEYNAAAEVAKEVQFEEEEGLFQIYMSSILCSRLDVVYALILLTFWWFPCTNLGGVKTRIVQRWIAHTTSMSNTCRKYVWCCRVVCCNQRVTIKLALSNCFMYLVWFWAKCFLCFLTSKKCRTYCGYIIIFIVDQHVKYDSTYYLLYLK